MSKKNKKIYWSIITIALLLITGTIFYMEDPIGIFGDIYNKNSVGNLQKKTSELNSNKEDEKEDIEKEKTIVINSLGNIIFHDKQIEGAKTEKGYNFESSFKNIKEIVEESDLSIGVVETTLSEGPDYEGYPLFKSPYEIVDALKDTGIDIVNYGSNHILDNEVEGVIRTLNVTKEKGLDVIGIRKNKEESKYLIKEIKGKKIGFISYVYETPMSNGNNTINSIIIPEEVKPLINTFNYGKLEEYYEDVRINIEEMKSKGVEFIIVANHWGEEYESNPNDNQKDMAKKLGELGANIVLGGHPHVIQPYETIINSRGEKVFVAYSQGNCLSNQCFEEIQNYRTEDGIIFNFTLGIKEDKLYLKEYEVIPTWVLREEIKENKYSHTIIPLNKEVSAFKNTGNSEDGELQSLQRTLQVIGDWSPGKKEF